MDLQIFAIIIGVIVIGVIGAIIYIRRTGAKPIESAAVLYHDWTEKFGLEPLSNGSKAAESNAKILAKNLKLLWDKRELEELDLRPEIANLTQDDALAFVTQANSLFLDKSTKSFAYDIHDARDGNLRLFTLEKDSKAYKNFTFGQAVIKLLRSKANLEQFPDIELPEGAEDRGLANLDYFVIAQAGIDTDPEALFGITATLAEKLGDEWDVFLVADDVLKFAKAVPEEEVVEEEKDLSPFAQQKEAKRIAEEAAEAERTRAEVDRRLRWEKAEEEKKAKEISARDAAIAAGEISELSTKPLAFLSQAIEIAADEAGILSLDDEAEIKRSDRIGRPTLFSVYSDELVDTTTDEFKIFTSKLIAILDENFGGPWEFEANDEQVSSISFARGIL